ncbi:MAG: transporter, partial [Gammaproteobacteria bacterium]|nr:transporter [Gammaproteobacteria bacterium]
MTDTSLIQGQVIDSYALERKLAIIFFAKAITAFSTAVLYSSLNLYLISDLHFGEKYAAQLVGVFLGISYLLPLIGGYIGNRLIDFKALFCIGSSFQI